MTPRKPGSGPTLTPERALTTARRSYRRRRAAEGIAATAVVVAMVGGVANLYPQLAGKDTQTNSTAVQTRPHVSTSSTTGPNTQMWSIAPPEHTRGETRFEIVYPPTTKNATSSSTIDPNGPVAQSVSRGMISPTVTFRSPMRFKAKVACRTIAIESVYTLANRGTARVRTDDMQLEFHITGRSKGSRILDDRSTQFIRDPSHPRRFRHRSGPWPAGQAQVISIDITAKDLRQETSGKLAFGIRQLDVVCGS